MADRKISQLDPTVLLTGDEEVAVVQPVDNPKDNKKITIEQIKQYTDDELGITALEERVTDLEDEPGVQTVTGFQVDNTDPLNPVIIDSSLVYISSGGHSRSVGDVVINNGVTKFDASMHDPARIWGVVETVTDANNFIVRKIQTGDVVNNLSGLTADTLYYIQDNGSISSSQTLLPIGVALGTTTIRFGLNTDLYWSIILTG